MLILYDKTSAFWNTIKFRVRQNDDPRGPGRTDWTLPKLVLLLSFLTWTLTLAPDKLTLNS